MPEGLQPCAPCSAVSSSLCCWDLPACRLWLQCWSFLVGALLTSRRPTDPSKLLVVSWDDFEASETPQCALRYPGAYTDLRTQQTLPGSPAALQGALNYAQTSSICSWVNEGLPHAPQRSPRAPHPTSPCPPATLLITEEKHKPASNPELQRDSPTAGKQGMTTWGCWAALPSTSPAGSKGTDPAKPVLLPTLPLLLLFRSSSCWNDVWIYSPICTPLSCSQ